ncbi:hypothetical protein CBS101457_003630 [Exobasidium rhododendri]|nr:hypothetical protein CBS101457_003630 [Exobasidium rhododendri]
MDIPLSSDALDVSFHPSSTSNLIAAGLISGKIQLIDYTALVDKQARSGHVSSSDDEDEDISTEGDSYDEGEDDDEDDDYVQGAADTKGKGKARLYSKRWTVRPSNKSCRGVYFDQDGSSLWSLSKDGSIIKTNTETGSTVCHWKKAHEAAPSRLIMIEPNLLATGDDDGVVSLWDPRQSSPSAIRSYTHHFDWITSFLWCKQLAPPRPPKLSKEEQEKRKIKDEKKRRKKEKRSGYDEEEEARKEEEKAIAAKASRERLVCTSGDGTLSVIDIRSGPAGVDVSEDQEDELLSIASVKHDSKLVVGTQMGILSLWAPARGLLDHVDRIPGHPASVDTMCTLDHDTILTGSSDGLVRVVQILPHKLLGIVADHGGLPVERLAIKGNWLASIGHGADIKLTDLSSLLEEEEDDDDGDGDDDDDDDDDAKEEGNADIEEDQNGAEGADEGDAVEQNEERNSSEDDESDSEEEAKPLPKKSRLETILSQGDISLQQEDQPSSFFDDL